MLRNFQTKNFIMVKIVNLLVKLKLTGVRNSCIKLLIFTFPFCKIELVHFIVSLNVMNFFRKFLWRNSSSWSKRSFLTWLIFWLSHNFYFIKFSERYFYWANYLPVTRNERKFCLYNQYSNYSFNSTIYLDIMETLV